MKRLFTYNEVIYVSIMSKYIEYRTFYDTFVACLPKIFGQKVRANSVNLDQTAPKGGV